MITFDSRLITIFLIRWFACLAKIIHIDIDPAEIGKNKIADLALIGDVKKIFQQLLIFSLVS